ncbi:MAG: hypothetical protein Q4P32_11715 [Micrococcales bacterium]|nr:hypothetical protein [Micrococcales bacterium]
MQRQTDPSAQRAGFSRYLTPRLLPVTFWLVVTYLVLDGAIPIIWAAAGGTPLAPLLGPILVALVKIVALGCLARVVLEACDHAYPHDS